MKLVKTYHMTFIGGPDSGRTRRECWEARSDDGIWLFERLEEPGTPWQTIHLPSNEVWGDWTGTLKSAVRQVEFEVRDAR